MKKLFPIALALASFAMIPAAHAALPNYNVSVINGSQSVSVGTWRLTLDQEVYSDVLGADACQYFVSWKNASVLPIRADLHVLELMQNDYTDCEENAQTGFDTLILLGEGTNKGFDKFQQKKTVTSIVLGEDESGALSGIIQLGTNIMYPFRGTAGTP